MQYNNTLCHRTPHNAIRIRITRFVYVTPSSGRHFFHSFFLLFLFFFFAASHYGRHRETLSAGTKPKTSHHRSPGAERRGKRKRQTIFLKRTREGHRQSDEHWNRFKGDVGETSERRCGEHVGFSERIDTILN